MILRLDLALLKNDLKPIWPEAPAACRHFNRCAGPVRHLCGWRALDARAETAQGCLEAARLKQPTLLPGGCRHRPAPRKVSEYPRTLNQNFWTLSRGPGRRQPRDTRDGISKSRPRPMSIHHKVESTAVHVCGLRQSSSLFARTGVETSISTSGSCRRLAAKNPILSAQAILTSSPTARRRISPCFIDFRVNLRRMSGQRRGPS